MSDIPSRLNTALEGRYTIERELGQGGMATVYLADDLKHERKVALKLLKPELAAVVGAERFLAEIKTTAALQHPNILPLFDSGEADGFLFYVMPYVQGETLRERINREKQLPIDEALGIATAVANALQAAHDQGVVHRDIKPANILLSGGQPLVADFGIALAVGAASGSRLTETGLSLGTPFYMSPEQATGDQHVGPASDTYALAALLYEMLTGDPPYIGSTAQAVLGKIIQGAPVSATAIRRSVPANVDAAINKALEKLPADRFTGASDFARALADPGFRHGDERNTVAGTVATRWRRAALALAASTVVFAAAGAWALTRPAPPQTPIRLSMELEPAVSTTLGIPQQMTISPDGSFLVYSGAAMGDQLGGRLWLRRLEELNPVPIPGTEGGHTPSIAPDGSEVAFISGAGTMLQAVALTGGVARTLSQSVLCCTKWSTDGFVYFVSSGFELLRVPATGGDAQRLKESGAFEFQPFPTSDGDAVLFTLAGLNSLDVHAVRLETGEVTVVFEGASAIQLLPTGHLLMTDPQGRLLVAAFDSDRLELRGDPVPLVEGLRVEAGGAGSVAVSESGTLVYLAGERGAERYRPVWVDRSGSMAPVDPLLPDWEVNAASPSNNRGWAISPDGSRLAIGIVSPDGSDPGDIWVKRLPSGAFQRLTTDAFEQARPRWTPEGTSVTYISNVAGGPSFSLFRQRADGLGEPELLRGAGEVSEATAGVLEGVISADGLLAMRSGVEAIEGDTDIFAMRPGQDSVPAGVLTGEFSDRAISISPDGRWLAHESDESGQVEVFVRSFPDATQRKEQVSLAGGFMPVWSRSGRELFYINRAREMVAVDVTTGDDFQAGESRVLFALPEGTLFSELEYYATYDVDTDDQRFLMLNASGGASRSSVVVVFNWLDEAIARLGN